MASQDRQPGLVHEVCAEPGRRPARSRGSSPRISTCCTRGRDRRGHRTSRLAGNPFLPSVRPADHLRQGGAGGSGGPVARTASDCGAVVKPDITFFGEMLPAGALEEAFSLAAQVDLLLVLGSSLVVQPAASVPLATLEAGGRLAIVNLDPHPWTTARPAAGRTWKRNSRPWPAFCPPRHGKISPLNSCLGLIFDNSPGSRCSGGRERSFGRRSGRKVQPVLLQNCQSGVENWPAGGNDSRSDQVTMGEKVIE